MKLELAFFLALSPLALNAQIASSAFGPTVLVPNHVIAAGPHERIWQSVTVDPQGVTSTHSYTELATGLNWWNSNTGAWEPSTPDFSITNGYAIATRCQHKLIVAGNLNDPEGLLDVQMPDGQRLRMTVLGLNLFDPVSGKSLQVGAAQDCVGQQTAPNEITFFDAFQGLQGSVRIRNEVGQFHQDVLLAERLTVRQLARLGFDDPSSLRLEVWAEVLEAPTPNIRSVIVSSQTNTSLPAIMAEPNAMDDFIGFETLQIARSLAFIDGESGRSVPMLRQWMLSSGRNLIIESVNLSDLEALWQYLPTTKLVSLERKQVHSTLIAQRAPPQPVKTTGTGAFQMGKLEAAQLRRAGPQVALDPVFLNGTMTNYTFQCGTTYCLSNNASVSLMGTNVIEGGCVIKYGTNSSIQVVGAYFPAKLDVRAGPYRPVICTSIDDQSVGETIQGSAPFPTNYYANPALSVSLAGSQDLTNLHIAYAKQAVLTASTIALRLYDSQFVNCQNGVSVSGGNAYLRNALFSNTKTNFTLPGGAAVDAQNVTFNTSAYLTSLAVTNGQTVSLVNCILANVTNLAPASPPFTPTGSYNGFYNSPQFGTAIFSTNSNPFQTVGAGAAYLVNGSTFRDVGTANIDSTLLNNLRGKTTYPPTLYSGQFITTNLTLSPLVPRDTNAPDLGAHYDPIDAAFQQVAVTNATLTVSPGTVIATAGPYGLGLQTGTRLICQGSVSNLIHIVRYNMAQEHADSTWNVIGPSIQGDWLGGGAAPQASFRFTDWSMPAADAPHFQSYSLTNVLWLTDCQLHGGQLLIWAPTLALTNDLFERVQCSMDDSSYGVAVSPTVRNCLFLGGQLSLTHWEADTWSFRDNLFDQAAISQDGVLDHAYDGYTTGSARLTPTNANDVVASLVYQAGPLGKSYQPINSAFIDKGSVTNAGLVGLYHYTTQTNLVGGLQVKDGGSRLDIGLHYVAVDANGIPIDSDHDGLADVVENVNGSGVYGAGDLCDWTKADTDGDGMPDGWELANGLNPKVNDANGDLDSDGITNFQEYIGETNPRIVDFPLLFVAEPKASSNVP
jgi:hypothetical protein